MIKTNREKKYVLFGAGEYGKRAIRYLSEEKIAYFLDNDRRKTGTNIEGIPVYLLEEKRSELINYTVVISVSKEKEDTIARQLDKGGVTEYIHLKDEYSRIIKQRVENSKQNLDIYQSAVQWIEDNTLNEKAICYVSGGKEGYPEVTGYFIPSLLKWGYREMAVSYAQWLCSIQRADGAWGDAAGTKAFIFDTGQILKGLLAVSDLLPEVKDTILRGCEWLVSKIESDGRLPLLNEADWGVGVANAELVHLYCLSPLKEVSVRYGIPQYGKKADEVLNYYKRKHREDIVRFERLSHFQAYVLEGLVDLGEVDLAREGMEVMAEYLDRFGYVPAYRNVGWVCSTGLFQLAVIWFKLGEVKRGNQAFAYACELQNESGGWYGSYPTVQSKEEENTYFPYDEISWAGKFFLDALHAKSIAEFEVLYEGNHALESFHEIDKTSELYQVVYESVKRSCSTKGAETVHVLDVGCGWGRYIRRLSEDFPSVNLYAVELIPRPLECMEDLKVHKAVGSLTNIPHRNAEMDVVYTCEALEHAIDIKNAIREMARVTKPGGMMIVVDKNLEALGCMKMMEWEQYFDENKLRSYMEAFCEKVTVIHGLRLNEEISSSLFSAWIGRRK